MIQTFKVKIRWNPKNVPGLNKIDMLKDPEIRIETLNGERNKR